MQAVDPGQKMRMDILRRDAERKIFEKLRTHNWSEKIEREFPDGLIISAERGGHSPIPIASSLVPIQLALAPMCVFARGVKIPHVAAEHPWLQVARSRRRGAR